MRKIIPSLVIIAMLAASCVEPIVMDPLDEMPVVVSCVLERGHQAQYLDLHYAKRPSETKATPITDATVVVTGKEYDPQNLSEAVVDHQFTWNGERWQCNFLPVFGAKYSLKVILVDGRQISSSTTFPADLRLVGCMGKIGSEQEAPSKKVPYDAFYFAKYFKTTYVADYYTDGHNTYTFYDSYEGYAPYRGEVYAWIVAGSRLSTDHPDADKLNLRTGSWADLDPLEGYDMNSRSSAYVSYCSGLPLYQDWLHIHQQDGFAGNMPEGLIPEQEYNTKYNATAKVPTESLFVLASDPSDGQKDAEYGYATMDVFRVFFVSPEYDTYLRNMANTKIIHGGELTEIYSTEPVYTNIEGGLGIFGASYMTGEHFGRSKKPWEQ